MALHTCSLSVVALSKMDTKDVNDYLEQKGFDLRYHYHTATTEQGIDFSQFLDAGSRLSLRNENVDFHALMRHIDTNLNCKGAEG